MTLSAGDFVAEVLFCVCFTVHDISQSLFSLALGLKHFPQGIKWSEQGKE
jgi:hypothetical protein